MTEKRRWHLFSSRFGEFRFKDSEDDLKWLDSKGFRAKIGATLPRHKTSGHTHVVVLCSKDDLSELTESYKEEHERATV